MELNFFTTKTPREEKRKRKKEKRIYSFSCLGALVVIKCRKKKPLREQILKRFQIVTYSYLSPAGAGRSTFFTFYGEMVAKASQGLFPPPFWISMSFYLTDTLSLFR